MGKRNTKFLLFMFVCFVKVCMLKNPNFELKTKGTFMCFVKYCHICCYYVSLVSGALVCGVKV